MSKITSDAMHSLMAEFKPVAERMETEGFPREDILRAFQNFIGLWQRRNFKAISKPPMTHASVVVKSIIEGLEGCQDQLNTNSKTEVALYYVLKKAGIVFAFQRQVGRYRADFVIGSLIVEVDGPELDRHVKRDQTRDKYLRKLCYKIMRVPAVFVAVTPEAVIQAIQEQAK